MKGLKCTTANCEHNVSCKCCAGIINISRGGVCNTKQKREFGILGQQRADMEAAAEFDLEKNSDLLVQCQSVDCIYNRNMLCASKSVNVADGLMRTKCFTRHSEK